MRVCIVGASGKLGQYMIQHALDRRYEVVGVCRESSVGKLERYKDRLPHSKYAKDIRYNAEADTWERRITTRWDVFFVRQNGNSFSTF